MKNAGLPRITSPSIVKSDAGASRGNAIIAPQDTATPKTFGQARITAFLAGPASKTHATATLPPPNHTFLGGCDRLTGSYRRSRCARHRDFHVTSTPRARTEHVTSSGGHGRAYMDA